MMFTVYVNYYPSLHITGKIDMAVDTPVKQQEIQDLSTKTDVLQICRQPLRPGGGVLQASIPP